MPTLDEILQAARNADAAGDAAAAKRLLEIYSENAAGQTPQPAPVTAVLPPRVEDQALPTYRVDSFGPTIEAATEAPVEATKFYAARTIAPDRTIPQRAGDAAMTGLNALGSGVAFGAGLVGEMVGGSPTQEKKLARDLLLASQVAVPELAGVSSVTRAAAPTARAVERVNNPTDRQSAARAAGDLGITPSLGMTGSTGARLAGALESAPGSAAVIARDAERAVAEIESKFRSINSGIGRARGADAAGEQLQSALKGFVREFEAASEKLYNVVDAYIPQGQVIRLDKSADMLKATQDLYQNNPALARRLGVDQWAEVFDEVREKGVPWQAARDLRSRIGRAIGSKGDAALADKDLGDLKQLYAALSDDLTTAARAAGPDAAKAWGRANRYYAAGRKRIDEALDKTITAQSPERAFEAFDRMMRRDVASADISRIRKIRGSMGRDDWNDLSASVLDRMGRAKPGAQNADGDVFSASTFLTNWNRMAPEAKRLLVPEEARGELDKLLKVVEASKDGARQVNSSRTGNVLVNAMTFGPSLVGDVATTGALLGGQFLSAQFMTSAPALRALNRAARGDTRALKRLSNGDTVIAQDATTILRLMGAEAAVSADAANSNLRPIAIVPSAAN